MKTISRRMLAFALVVCTLLGLLVPAAFAEETAETTADVVYDFMQYDTGDGRASLASKIEDLATRYADANDPLNWKFEKATGTVVDANGVPMDPNVSFTIPQGFRVMSKAGDLFAFRIQSPGAGEYELSLNMLKLSNGAAKSDIYILPGETTDIAAGMTEDTLVGSVSYYIDATDLTPEKVNVGNWKFEADKEYIVVFSAAENNSSNKRGYMYWTSLGMDLVEKTVYDFMQYDTGDGRASLASKIEDLETRYADANDPLNWKFEKATGFVVDENGVPNDPHISFTIPQGFRVMSNQGDWFAFRIKSPGAGEYKLKLNLLKFSNGAINSNIYVLPGDTADIAAGMTEDTLVGSVDYYSMDANYTPATATAGSWEFEADKEYIVVFEAAEKKTRAYMYWTSLEMTPVEKTVYQFSQSKYGSNKITKWISELATRYADPADSLNWKYETSYDDEKTDKISFYPATEGMRLAYNEGEWAAFRFQSPGQGIYDVCLKHGVGVLGAKVANLYILPASTTDIEGELAKATPVLTFDSYAAANAPGGKTDKVACEFAEGQEYIAVFQAVTKNDTVAENKKTAYIFPAALEMAVSEVTDTEPGTSLPEPEVLGEPVKKFAMTNYAAYGVVNGALYYYAPAKGYTLYVYNMDTGEKVDEIDTGFNDPRCCVVDSKGILYVSGSNWQILRYDPYTKTATKLPAAPHIAQYGNLLSLALDDEDNLYVGQAPDGRIFKFDVKTQTYTELGIKNADGSIGVYEPDCDNPVALYYHEGYLYAEIYGDVNADEKTTKVLLKIDVNTHEVVGRLDLTEKLPSDIKGFYFLSVIGDKTLIGGGYNVPVMIAVDMDTFQWIDVDFDSGNIGRMSDEINGKSYFIAYKKGLCEYDIATNTVKQVEGFEGAVYPIRSFTHSVVYLDDPAMPGPTIVGGQNGTGAPVLYNLETKTQKKLDTLVAADGAGQNLQSLANGALGSGDIYVGTYGVTNAVVYNTSEGKFTTKFLTAGQSDSLLYYNGKLYAGCYPGAVLAEVDPVTNTVKTLIGNLQSDYKQMRIQRMTAADGKVFFGSVPDTGVYGGLIGWYDVETGEIYVERNTVENHSPQSMKYYDGFLYVSTTKMGGSTCNPADNPDKGSAVIFVYDVANKKKIAQYDLSSIGIENADFIAGIAPDPNNPGKFWGIVSETLFSFTVDPETHEIVKFEKHVSYSTTSYVIGLSRWWFPREILFGADGNLYVCFASSELGFQKIDPANPTTGTKLMGDLSIHYVLGEDNNLYYTLGAELKKLDLQMQVNDAVVAERVQILIDAIGTVNARSKWTIDPARAAYDVLTDSQKALVTNYATLTAAEAAYAEIEAEADKEAADKAAAEEVTKKIEAIGEVTLSSEEAIKAARAAYEALTEGQKKLVDTAKLVAAEGKLAELKTAAEKEAADKAAAEAVIKQIEAIGTVTKESEAAIKAARAAYEALTAEQKALVTNLNVLTAAETALEALLKPADPEKPEDPKDPEDPDDVPQTGDTAPVALIAGILVMSMAALVLVCDIRRKRV